MAGRRVEPVAEALFGPFRLDLASEELTRDGRALKLQPQPLKVLCLLASRPGKIVSREEIRAAVWRDDTFVDFEHGINYCIKQIRDALGDDAEIQRYVETIPRKGYRFRGSAVHAQDGEKEPGRRRNVLALAGAAAGVALGVALGVVLLRNEAGERLDYTLSLPPPDGWSFGWEFGGGQVPTLSPDGRRLAFVALDAKATLPSGCGRVRY
ncbi:MAG TPA: winged helix-turn-helix domain-containing protein [Vicinamibacteria bacterium]|nr:winged helix-turn-helix domain-containing protein [Vicinamibacteria bacterium]